LPLNTKAISGLAFAEYLGKYNTKRIMTKFLQEDESRKQRAEGRRGKAEGREPKSFKP
jgi:hypothetical protein